MQAEPTAKPDRPKAEDGSLVLVPAPGLARGKYAAPAWLIGLAGLAVVLVVIAYFVIRFRKARLK